MSADYFPMQKVLIAKTPFASIQFLLAGFIVPAER
jgi:hypothetical protein